MRLKLPGRVVGVSRSGHRQAEPTVVLLHAFPLDRRMWDAVADELHLDAELCAVDFPGLGESSGRGATAVSIDDAADEVVAVLDEFGLSRVVACGVSMGGYVALSLAARHPERLAGLVLADTRANADSDAQRAVRDAAIARIAQQGSAGYVAEMVPRLCAPASTKARDLALAIAALQGPLGVAAALAALRDRPDRSSILPALSVPTTVVVGSEDALTPPEEARQMSRAIPGAALVEIPGAGHLTPIEAPGAFAAAVRRLLQQIRATAG